MRRHFVVVVVVLILLCLCDITSGAPTHTTNININTALSRQRVPPPQECPVLFSSRITGGTPLKNPTLGKYMTYFWIPVPEPETAHLCTGTLISSRWIITAAHCFNNATITLPNVKIGGRNANQGVEYDVENVIIHPEYNKSAEVVVNDIALILLKGTVKGFENGGDGVKVGEEVVDKGNGRVLGYGNIGIDEEREGNLSRVDLPIVETEKCRKLLKKAPYDDERVKRFAGKMAEGLKHELHVCAGYDNRTNCDTCTGDTGGPLLLQDDSDNFYLTGITSLRMWCGYINVYTRVSTYTEWIQKTTREAVTIIPSPRRKKRIIIIASVVGSIGLILILYIVSRIVRKVKEWRSKR